MPPASGHHRECLGHADSLACSVFVADLFFRNKPRQKENFLASFSVAGQVLAKHRISSTYVRFGDEHELTDGFLKLDALQHAYSKQPLTRGILVLGFGDAKTPFYLAELLRRVRRPGKTATNHTQYYGLIVDIKSRKVHEKVATKLVPVCPAKVHLAPADQAEYDRIGAAETEREIFE